MQLIDTHCHLQFDKLAQNCQAVIERAQVAGIKKMICVGTTLGDSQTAINLAGRHDGVWATAGIHPHDAKDFSSASTKLLSQLLSKPKVVAVGEIGLDYFKNYSPVDVQKQVFSAQLEAGLPSGLPFIFHVREAWDDFWQIFDQYPGLRGVIHN